MSRIDYTGTETAAYVSPTEFGLTYMRDCEKQIVELGDIDNT